MKTKSMGVERGRVRCVNLYIKRAKPLNGIPCPCSSPNVPEACTGSTHSCRDQSPCEHKSRQLPMEGEEGGGGRSELKEALPPPLALQKGPISQPPHVPACWNLSLRNHHRLHHLVYLVVERQQSFCTIPILPKVVKCRQAGAGADGRSTHPYWNSLVLKNFCPLGLKAFLGPVESRGA